MLALRLLGPVELSVDGAERELGGARQRIVLAALALNANRVTPIEQLVDAVWNTSPPSTARAQIQICISGLRRVLAGAPMQIRTRSPGYQLDIPETESDTAQFSSMVASARTHAAADRMSEAVATLRSALGLWRGRALAGMDSEPLRREAAKLEDARLAAVTERIRLDLALGRHEEVVGELFGLLNEHPLLERPYEFLMLALYRSGRQADALEVCRRARVTLVEELGIEPGRSMGRLETAILNRDPELDLPSTTPDHGGMAGTMPFAGTAVLVVPRRLPVSIADFTGRDKQLAEIKRVLSGEPGARFGTRIVAISGKGGVGKSTLAVRAAHELGDVYPDGHLFGDLDASEGEQRVRDVLVRFLRALGINGSTLPDDDEERAELYRSLLASRRVLIVLDSAVNEDQVLPLLPAGPGCAVIVTSRSPLSGLPGAYHVDVDLFDEKRSLDMLTRIVGPQRVTAERSAALELVRLCGGLPLAIRIAGARLASRPHWRMDVLVARLRNTLRRLDELSYRGLGLRSSINLSYRTLTPVERRLFQLLTLTTTVDFPGWTAAALLDIDSFDAAEAVEGLVEAQLLDTVQYPGERLRYRLHDLIRVFATERLLDETSEADRRSATSRLVGACMAGAEQAHRGEYGGDYTILHSSAPRWLVPDELATFDDPMEWLETERQTLVAAVYLAANNDMTELSWDLALTLVTLFEVKGHFDDWRETTQRALTATDQSGDRRGRAAMLYSLGTLYTTQRRLAEAAPCFHEALEIFEDIGDVHGCALVLRNAATVDRLLNKDRGMLAKYESARAKMRECGDVVGEAHVLQYIAKVRIDEDEPERARELLDTALACFQQVGYLRGEAQALNRVAELCLLTDEMEQAHRALNRVLMIVRDIGDHIGEGHALYRLGLVRQRTGRLDNAETTLRLALSVATKAGQRLLEGQVLYALGEIALARGQSRTGADHIENAHQLFAELSATVWHAKALILRSDIHEGSGESALADNDIEQAVRLLGTAGSAEAVRLQTELVRNRRVLVSSDSVSDNENRCR